MTPKTGRELARLREAKRLSQRELADQLDVSHGAVGAWETGASLPRQEYWARYAALLGTSIDVFTRERVTRRARSRKAAA